MHLSDISPDVVASTVASMPTEFRTKHVSSDAAMLMHLYTLHVETAKLPWDEAIAANQQATIEIDGEEVPILDGSAEPFVDALEEAGTRKQNAKKIFYQIYHNITFTDEEKKVEMVALPADSYRINTLIDFNSPVLGTQHADLKNICDFNKQIAPCRTFCFFHELEYLLDNDLIKGGDINNAIVVVNKPVTDAQVHRIHRLRSHGPLMLVHRLA